MNKLFALLVAALILFGAVMAQQTPAGTNISNQASASYIDSAGQARTTTSNQVITVVQQVYSFSITPDGSPATPGQTRTALAGAPVYFSYTVSNTGNGADTINLTLESAKKPIVNHQELSVITESRRPASENPLAFR